MKSKTKLLKEREIQEDNRTFEEIVEEIKQNVEIMADEYIPKLCTALKRQSPLISSVAIRAKVIEAVGKPNGPWKEGYIRQLWPDWMKNEKAVASGTLGGKQFSENLKARKNALTNRAIISQDDLDKDEEQTPVSSTPMYEYEETHPKTETSPFQTKGEINRAIHTLFGRLTGINHMPHMEDDVKKQYVIETRERAKDIINGISKIERDFLYNWLTWLGMVMDDWTNLLEKADKTAYDTRE